MAARCKYLSKLYKMAMIWEALGLARPGITACVGAGGKTSLLLSLAAAGERGRPVLVTATTKMFYHQVAQYTQVLTNEYGVGALQVARVLQSGKTAAWFTGRANDKVTGLPSGWIDRLVDIIPDAFILVEADGARRCLLKAPAGHEPVIPDCTAMTVGIVNLQAIGQPFSEANTHRLNLVTAILGKQAGDPIGWIDLARLLVHRQGIFQYALGTKVVVLTGGQNQASVEAARQIAGYVKTAGVNIARVVVTAGYGTVMRPVTVFT